MSTIIILFFLITGCTSSDYMRTAPRKILAQAKSGKTYTKRAAIVLTHMPATQLGQNAARLFGDTLIHHIQDRGMHLQLVTPQDKDFPEFMAGLSQESQITAFDLANAGRMQGWQGLITIAVLDIRAIKQKKGVLWLKKERYYLMVELALDLIDPSTGAKLISEIKPGKVKIDINMYNAIQSGVGAEAEPNLKDLNEYIIETAGDLGAQTAKVLNQSMWKATVTDIQDQRVLLSAGTWCGIKSGDRFSVFQARRFIQGQGKEKFIVPGYKIAQIEVVSVTDQTAQAVTSNPEAIMVGDIVVSHD
jgi:hypothetical protein